MALKDDTKKIQEAVGATPDGIYGKNTALKIIGKLDFSKEDLTKIIQKKTDGLPDGAYGPNKSRSWRRKKGYCNVKCGRRIIPTSY